MASGGEPQLEFGIPWDGATAGEELAQLRDGLTGWGRVGSRSDELNLMTATEKPLDDTGDGAGDAVDLGGIGFGDDGDAQRIAGGRKEGRNTCRIEFHWGIMEGLGNEFMTVDRYFCIETSSSRRVHESLSR